MDYFGSFVWSAPTSDDMPSSAVDYRSVCGRFLPVFVSFMTKRAKESVANRIGILRIRGKVSGATVGLLLSYLFWASHLCLLRCGDVESNPGPSEKSGRSSSYRQTKLNTSGNQNVSDDSSSSDFSALSKNLTDVMTQLHKMDAKSDDRFQRIEAEFKELKDSQAEMMKELYEMKQRVQNLEGENKELKRKFQELERKNDDLENRSKRNNLIFYGISGSSSKSP